MKLFCSRYYAICRPLEAQYTCTFDRMLKIVIAIWIISFLLCLPFVHMTIYKDSKFIDGTPIKVRYYHTLGENAAGTTLETNFHIETGVFYCFG